MSRFRLFFQHAGKSFYAATGIVAATSSQSSFWGRNIVQSIAFCDDDNSDPAAKELTEETIKHSESHLVIPEYDESDTAWEKEKMGCSFCKQFIVSPCKQQFKLWSKCVDLAKEKDLKFTEVCNSYTRALMDCVEQNSEFFSAYKDKMENERAEAGGSEEDTVVEDGNGNNDGDNDVVVEGDDNIDGKSSSSANNDQEEKAAEEE